MWCDVRQIKFRQGIVLHGRRTPCQNEQGKLSRSSPVAEAIDYMLKRWDGFTSFLDDGRICLTNNAAERALRGVALGKKSWVFAGSDRGGERAASMATLITSVKLNNVDPQAWLANILARIANTDYQAGAVASLELDAADRQCSSCLTCSLHRRLTRVLQL